MKGTRPLSGAAAHTVSLRLMSYDLSLPSLWERVLKLLILDEQTTGHVISERWFDIIELYLNKNKCEYLLVCGSIML